jgi:competence protein ComEC
MGRSARLAVGAICAALASQQVEANLVGAALALAMATLLVLGALTPDRRLRTAWPVMIGAGLILARLAIAPAGPAMLEYPPSGNGPWSLVVLATGSPRDGHQTATLGTPADVAPRFVVAATLPRYPAITPGERIRVEGSIRPRPTSPYGEYLARIGAVGTITTRAIEVVPAPDDPGRQLEALRRGAADALTRVLPEPEAGLAAGILIGLRDRVDRDLAAAFTTAGVSHVVAISGWNIAIVAAAIATLAGRLGRRRRSLVTILAIVAYVAFAGASASVVRAAAMAGVVLLARESGRAGRAAAALGWAATLLLLADPDLIGDAGFQLSSLATAGLIAWATPLTGWIDRVTGSRLPRWLAESLGVSLAAQAATLPIVLASFGRLAILSPIANLAVVPLVPPAMAVGLVALASGLAVAAGLPAGLGAILAAPGWVVFRILVSIVQFAASLPFASVTLEAPLDAAAAGLSVVAVAGLTWWRRQSGSGSSVRRPNEATGPNAGIVGTPAGNLAPVSNGLARRAGLANRDHAIKRALAMALVVATTVVGGVALTRPSGTARVTILDIGQGDAILVEGSRGGRLLIDGGPDPDRLLVALDRRLPPWDRRIDTVILSHPHEDHVAGLALLLARYDVHRVLEPGMRGPGPGYAAWLRELSSGRGPQRTGIAAGDRLTVDDISMRVLWPIRGRVPLDPPDGGTGINNVSVVLEGRVGSRRFLLMGDVEEEVDPVLLAADLPRVDLLKVAHHGSRTATTQSFVDAVRPRVAVASAGVRNPYGHPARATLERLAAAGARVLRTDQHGTVVVGFGTDGLTVRAEGPRSSPPTVRPSAPGAGLAARQPTGPTRATANGRTFRCAIPVTALVPEREPAPEPTTRRAVRSTDAGRAATVGYHRIDDRSRAGAGRLPPALPGTAPLVAPAFARRSRSGGLARRPDRRARCDGRPPACRGCRAAPRRRQGSPGRSSGPRAPPRRGVGGLVDRCGSPRAGSSRRGTSGHPPCRWRTIPALGRLRHARRADRGLRGQARGPAPRVDGRTVRFMAGPVSAGRNGREPRGLGCGHLRCRQGPSGPARGRRLPGCRCRTRGGAATRLDRGGAPLGAAHPDGRRRPMTTTLAYLWGDDELAASRAVDALQAALGSETGTPPERWDLRGDRNRAGEQIARLHERIATPAMFGGGSLAVVSNPGPLVQSTEQRAAFLAAMELVAPGNALVILDATASGAKAPSQKRLVDAVLAAGGTVRRYESPRRGALAGWIEAEARQRGLQLAAGAAKALADRIGGLADQNDVERRYLTRIASTELDKLALYRGDMPVSADDVKALVAEAVPGSVWGFTDAVGERRAPAAAALLDRLLDDTPEPVLLAVLHRRVRELLELGDRIGSGERLPAAARAMGITSDYRAQTLAAQAKLWTTYELTAALDGLVELDAMVKGAPGSGQDEAQRRLAFSLWVMEHAAR